MKNFVKIIAIVAIAVFAAVSCAPPEVDVSEYDWDRANERYDASGDAIIQALIGEFGVDGYSSDAKNPVITVTVPAQSDFLRSSNIEAGLKEFLTVQTFKELAADTTNGTDGKINTLDSALTYKLERSAGNILTIKLDKDFTATGTGDYSDLIVKIDATKYKYSNGHLLDSDLNGTAGEAGYDDLYFKQDLAGEKGWAWIAPGQKDWSVTLSLANVTFANDTPFASDTATATNTATIRVATITASGISDTSISGKAIYKDIADLVASGIKLEKLVNGAWQPESQSAVYEVDTPTTGAGVTYIYIKGVTLSHGSSYRVTWKGNGNLKTVGTYFGVNQRIRVNGTYPSTTNWPTSAIYAKKEVNTASQLVTNPGIVTYLDNNDAGFDISLYSYDLNNANVILEVTVPFMGDGTTNDPYVGLNKSVIDNLANFQKSFKIIYSTSTISNFSTLASRSDITYVGITKVEGIENLFPNSTTAKGIDTLRITLDPAHIGPRYVDMGGDYWKWTYVGQGSFGTFYQNKGDSYSGVYISNNSYPYGNFWKRTQEYVNSYDTSGNYYDSYGNPISSIGEYPYGIYWKWVEEYVDWDDTSGNYYVSKGGASAGNNIYGTSNPDYYWKWAQEYVNWGDNSGDYYQYQGGTTPISIGENLFDYYYKWEQEYVNWDDNSGDYYYNFNDSNSITIRSDYYWQRSSSPGDSSWEYVPDMQMVGGSYYFLIDDGFGYTGGKYLYGNLSNFAYDNAELYSGN